MAGYWLFCGILMLLIGILLGVGMVGCMAALVLGDKTPERDDDAS